MLSNSRHTLPKEERLCSRKALEELFGGGHYSTSAYPIRAVYMKTQETGIHMMVSVSKRYFKRAIHRNRIKRQLREAYRLNKHLLVLPEGGMNIAFLWTSHSILSTAAVFHKMQTILSRVHDAINSEKTSL